MSRNWVRSWPLYCLLMAGIFFIRGLVLLCVYPPLEGCDEYQHIAYLVFISETGELPVLGRDLTPESICEDLVANPHSEFDVMQTGRIGCRSYSQFFREKPGETHPGRIKLYQAQHPPAYYLIFHKLYEYARANSDFRTSVSILRIINLLLSAIGIFLFTLPIRKLFADAVMARLTGLAVAVAPMPLTYCLRVSNDAMAFMFAGAVFATLMSLNNGEKFISKTAALTILIAGGIWVKLTVFMYLPVAAIFLLYTTVFNDIPLRKIMAAVIVMSVLYGGIAGPYHCRVMKSHGTPLLSQEAVENLEKGERFQDNLKRMEWSHLNRFFMNRMLKGSLWISGWSFLKTRASLIRIYAGLIIGGLAGIFPLLFIRFRNRDEFPPDRIHGWVLCGIVSIMAFGAAYYHALNSIAAHGEILTPGYYLAPGYAAFIAWVMASYSGYRNRFIGMVGVISLIVLMIFTEIYSTVFIAIPVWYDTVDVMEIIRRIASVHALFPGPFLMVPILGIYFIALLIAIVSLKESGNTGSM